MTKATLINCKHFPRLGLTIFEITSKIFYLLFFPSFSFTKCGSCFISSENGSIKVCIQQGDHELCSYIKNYLRTMYGRSVCCTHERDPPFRLAQTSADIFSKATKTKEMSDHQRTGKPHKQSQLLGL